MTVSTAAMLLASAVLTTGAAVGVGSQIDFNGERPVSARAAATSSASAGQPQGKSSSPAAASAAKGPAAGRAAGASTTPTPRPTSTSSTGARTRSPRDPSELEAGATPGPSDRDYRLPGLPGERSSAPVTLPSQEDHARDALVGSFPRRVLPVAPASRVLSSSVSPTDGKMQVALVGQLDRHTKAASVLRFYRQVLTAGGFAEQPTSAVGGAEAAAFRRNDDSVVVTVGPGETYSVFATLTGRRA